MLDLGEIDIADYLDIAESYMHVRGLEFVDDKSPPPPTSAQGVGTGRTTPFKPLEGITPQGMTPEAAAAIGQQMAANRAYDPRNPGPTTPEELLAEQRRMFPDARRPESAMVV